MDISHLQVRRQAHLREIETLQTEIRALNREMENVIEAEVRTRRMEEKFVAYIAEERSLKSKMEREDKVRSAIMFANRLNPLISERAYNTAMSRINGIMTRLRRRKTQIESAIARNRRRIQTLQDMIGSLDRQIVRQETRSTGR